jgi:hypothetical protein
MLAGALFLSAQTSAPKIWDDKALEDWATPIAALGVRPGHFRSKEYYSAPVENLKTYPVYRPDREPPGYWEWLQTSPNHVREKTGFAMEKRYSSTWTILPVESQILPRSKLRAIQPATTVSGRTRTAVCCFGAGW